VLGGLAGFGFGEEREPPGLRPGRLHLGSRKFSDQATIREPPGLQFLGRQVRDRGNHHVQQFRGLPGARVDQAGA